jgi:cytochrome c nitrite reductase small subunit
VAPSWGRDGEIRRAIPVLAIGIAVGLVLGVGVYTFVYARGASYLTDNAAACANCHIMREHLDGWITSSHRAVAVCNDCHTPAGLVPKYAVKTANGFWHSFAFTSGRFHEPIRITRRNLAVTEAACQKCHAATVQAMGGHGEGLACTRCHGSVGHLR